MESLTFSKLSYSLSQALTLIIFFFIAIQASAARLLEPQSRSNADFVKTSCKLTMYPKICYRTLSVYASNIQASPEALASAALSVTLDTAQSTSDLVLELSKRHGLNPREAVAITECVETMRDSVDELRQSVAAMKDLKGPDFEMKINDQCTLGLVLL